MENNFFVNSKQISKSVKQETDSCSSSFFGHCDNLEQSHREFNKGKSFNYSKWDPSTEYSNNAFIQDFVTYNGDLYVCIESNVNEIPTNSNKWIKAVEKIAGQVIVPNVDDDGNISWSEALTSDTIFVETKNIRGNSVFTGIGEPNNITKCKVQDTYIDSKLGMVYKCVSVNPEIWEIVGQFYSPGYFQWCNLDE